MKDETISYDLIAKAQLFYAAMKYRNIQTPWMVTPTAIRATLPPTVRSIDSIFGSLVGSGEQGFIQMMLDGTLEPGRYQTTTPCFRDEAVIDEFTRPYFLKVELISYMPADPRADYEKLLNDAMSCFFQLSTAETFDAVHTTEGFDLFYRGVELGSYGIRQLGDHIWVYGTGLAEPRFSLALNRSEVEAETPSLPAIEDSSSDQIPLPFLSIPPVE
jgi:hypothetical protein